MAKCDKCPKCGAIMRLGVVEEDFFDEGSGKGQAAVIHEIGGPVCRHRQHVAIRRAAKEKAAHHGLTGE